MKKYISIVIAAMLVMTGLCACRRSSASDEKKLQIVTTIFPEYDWVQNVLGENPSGAEVTMLLDNGVDLHSYQPTAEDILKISTCDLFIYVGGESDEWVEDALKTATNKDMVVINLLETLGDKVVEEEVIEGMEGEEEEGEGEAEEEPEYDEHVWLSLRNSTVLVDSISDALKKIDAKNASVYEKNAASYKEKLSALDAKYAQAVSEARVKTLLFGDRFPFRYLVDDYGLTYYAAFVGCSAETEASFETIAFLSAKLDELKLPAILTIEGGSRKVAETILYNTPTHDQKILVLDSMQSTVGDKAAYGQDYLAVMRKNLEVLKEALK